MSSNTEAKDVGIAVAMVLMVVIYAISALAFFAPTLWAVKRIEANQQKCQEHGK